MRIVTIDEMRQIERIAFEHPMISEQLIIENVGIRSFDFIMELLESNSSIEEVVVLVGKGNNGADGLATARHLLNNGIEVITCLLFPDDETTTEHQLQLRMLKSYGAEVQEIRHLEELDSCLLSAQAPLIVDAILGTGLRFPLPAYLQEVFELANSYGEIIVALDIPSGVCGQSGKTDKMAIMADYTLAIELPKIGHFINLGPLHSGEIYTIHVGFPREILFGGDKFLLDDIAHLEQRNPFAHKNDFGHLLVIGGNKGYTGAALLTATAGLKMGAGLVTVHTWEQNYLELAARALPEVMTGIISEGHDYSKYGAIVIGPGLGHSDIARQLVCDLLKTFTGPLIVDADAINCLSITDAKLLKKRSAPTVFTPHVGEFVRFLNVDKKELAENYLQHVKDFQERTGQILILKSFNTIIATAESMYINHCPNDGLATAGSGDVLAGILGGLSLQNTDMQEVSIAGVLMHAQAGQVALKKYGARYMSASNIIEGLKDEISDEELEENC